MTKISDLTALTGASVDTATDLVPVVDMSETGAARNKKITVAEFFLAIREAIDDRMDTVLVAGTNIALTYDDGAGTITIDAATAAGDVSGLSEAIDDRVAALLQAGSNVTLTYNDGAGTLTIASSGGGSFTAASTTEVLTGTDSAKGVTSDSLAALWEQGSDVASSGTISIGEGGYFNITGTTTITDIDFATDKAGREAWVKFAGILTLTHNASTLILPTGTSITTAAGDTACFVSEGSDVVRCVAYNRASGAALTGGGGDVVGPGSSTAGHVAVFDGATGKLLKDGGVVAFANGATIVPTAAPATTEVGYLGCPQNTQNGSYTTVMADAGKHIYHTSGSAHTWTIDSNANVAYPIGTILTFLNESGGGIVTLAITSDTLRWGSSTGSRSLAANATATAIKVTSTAWRLTGDGIT